MNIPCPSHPYLCITNVCKKSECVEPLCPECITSHVSLHAQNNTIADLVSI